MNFTALTKLSPFLFLHKKRDGACLTCSFAVELLTEFSKNHMCHINSQICETLWQTRLC